MMMTATCAKCKQEKPLDEFYLKKGGLPRSYCKLCVRANELERYHANPTLRRDQQMQARYGITADEYNVMLEAQGGVCAICKEPEIIKGRRLAVDHDHETGENRMLLCSKCNHGLGNFNDNPHLLEAAIEYLHAFSKERV